MATTKEYIETPNSHEILSENQARSMILFTEVIYENAVKRWMKVYANGDLVEKILIIHPCEDENQILNLFTTEDNDYRLSVRKDKVVSNGYTSWKEHSYDNLVLDPVYTQKVFDSFNHLIAVAIFDSSDNLDEAIYKLYRLSGKEVLDGNGEVDYYFDDDDEVEFSWYDGSLKISATFGEGGVYTSMAAFKNAYPEILPVFGANVEVYFSNMLPMIPSFTL